MSANTTNRGFTLVEVLVVTPVMVLTIAVIGTLLVNILTDLSKKNATIDLQIQSQSVLFNIRDELFYANRFAGEIQPDTTDSYAPSGGWNAIEDNALIVYESAYTANRQNPDRQLVHLANTPHPCSSEEVIENQFATNTIIYFKQGTTLFRRVLVPNQAGNCESTYRKQSCPAANSNLTCPSDTVMAENVKSFNVKYFRRTTNQGEIAQNTLLNTPDIFIQVTRADINITLEKYLNGEPTTVSAVINIKKIE